MGPRRTGKPLPISAKRLIADPRNYIEQPVIPSRACLLRRRHRRYDPRHVDLRALLSL